MFIHNYGWAPEATKSEEIQHKTKKKL